MRAFISYSRTDQSFLINFVQLVRAVYGNDSVWFDEDILGGEDWWKKILGEIKKCDIFIYLISNESLESSYCQDEMKEALRLNKQILPVIIRQLNPSYPGNVAPDLITILTSTQYVDLTNQHDAKAIAKLYAALRRLQPSHPRRRKKRLFGISLLLLVGTISFVLLSILGQPQLVFPQFSSIGYFRDHAANFTAIRYELTSCAESCLSGVKKILDIDAIIEENGYAVVHFVVLPLSKVDLGSYLLLRVSVQTTDPDFEVAMWDATRSVFFHCRAQAIGQTQDFLISLDEADLTQKGFTFQPQQAIGLSIGFAQSVGSDPGHHHMKVYGIVSGDNLDDRNLSQVNRCVIQG